MSTFLLSYFATFTTSNKELTTFFGLLFVLSENLCIFVIKRQKNA